MTIKRKTRFIPAAIVAAAIAGPAIAASPPSFVNQGPHAFGDPAASGVAMPPTTAPPGFVNQGPHGFGDPAAAPALPSRPMVAPAAPANRGPHPLGG